MHQQTQNDDENTNDRENYLEKKMTIQRDLVEDQKRLRVLSTPFLTVALHCKYIQFHFYSF
jgi:hypothetical protein